MSRQLHAVEVPESQHMKVHNARLAAAAVLITVFTALVIFAPASDPAADVAPAMTAAATEQAEE